MGQMCSFGTKEDPLATDSSAPSSHSPSSGGGVVNTTPTIPSATSPPIQKPSPPSNVTSNVASWQSKASNDQNSKPSAPQPKSNPPKSSQSTKASPAPAKNTPNTANNNTKVSQPAPAPAPTPVKASQPAPAPVKASQPAPAPAQNKGAQPAQPAATQSKVSQPAPAQTKAAQPAQPAQPAKPAVAPAKASTPVSSQPKTTVSQPAKAAAPAPTPTPAAAQPKAQNGKNCGKCNKPLGSGDVIEAMGKEFHESCFVCSVCSKPIEGRFAQVGGLPACPPCSIKKTAASLPPKVSGPTGMGMSHFAGPTSAPAKATGQMGLFQWVKNRTEGYAGVEVKNWTTSWQDGLAYCALLHSYHPNLIDYKSLKPENKKANIDLAYSVADKLGIVELLEKEDFALEKLSMMTQMSEVYKTLNK